MKKSFLILSAALVLAACSEKTEEPVTNVLPHTTIYVAADQAALSADPTSRATFNDEAQPVWESDDAIALYAASYGEAPASTLAVTRMANDGKVAWFAGEGVTPAETDTFYAAYPVPIHIDASGATFAIAANQPAVTKPRLVVTAQAESVSLTDLHLTFLPAVAFLHVQIAEGLNIDAVRFEGFENEAVAGDYTCAFDGTRTLSNTATSITVANPGTECWITLPVVTLAKGYRLTFTRGSETMVKSYGYGASKSIEAGITYEIPAITEFTPISVTLGTVRTSWTIHESEGVEAANAFAGNAIEVGNSSFAGLPNKLVAKTGFVWGSTEIPTSMVDAASSKEFSGNTVTLGAADWTDQTVYAFVEDVMGNRYTSAPVTVTVTGIPYKLNLHDDQTDWTCNNTRKTGGKFAITYDGSDGWAISPKYNYAGAVDYSLQVQYYVAGVTPSNFSAEAYVGVTDSNEAVATTYDSISLIGSNNTGTNAYDTLTGSATLSHNYFSVYHNHPDAVNVIKVFGREIKTNLIDYVNLYEFEVKYK